jgi:hypothetical protein
MTIRRIAIIVSFVLGLSAVPFAALSYYSFTELSLQAYNQNGSIIGQVQASGQPQAGVQVVAYRRIAGMLSFGGSSITGQQGTYQVTDLAPGGYVVWFWSADYASEWYENAFSAQAARQVNVTSGQVTSGIDAQLELPQEPLATAEISTGGVTTNPGTGEITVSIPTGSRSDVQITRRITCASGNPVSALLRLTTNNGTENYSMSQIGQTTAYEATIPQAVVQSGSLIVQVTCSNGVESTSIGQIVLYDPSGIVTNARTNQPVEGAQVQLFELPGWEPKTSASDNREETCHTTETRPGTDWTELDPARDPENTLGLVAAPDTGRIDPAVNPQTTTPQGRYGWDVAEGCWYVVVQAEGYATTVSPIVGVPPAVEDLDLTLEPTISPLYLPLIAR